MNEIADLPAPIPTLEERALAALESLAREHRRLLEVCCKEPTRCVQLMVAEDVMKANAALRGAEPASSAERPLEGTVMRKEEEC